MTEPSRAKQVFLDALDLPEGEREDYVARTCGDDAALRARVLALLAAGGRADELLGPAAGLALPPPAAARAAFVDLGPGDSIGPYTLEDVLGEGGFGVVFRARQDEPVRRHVALKVVKPGMDTASALARFEQERQMLALMDHPHIARVFDAGSTPGGRPYFVMELVDGQPITEHCEHQALSLEERLRLFETVCHAVQHAHQRGVLHRDIKPSNVLVADVEGRPVPRIIDFGIAKAVGDARADGDQLTRQGMLIGTPDTMSPEQAAGSADVDTRADVYSLGVLLFQLVTGELPFDTAHLGLADALAVIRHQEPPRPSTRRRRLTGAASNRATSAASNRATSAASNRATSAASNRATSAAANGASSATSNRAAGNRGARATSNGATSAAANRATSAATNRAASAASNRGRDTAAEKPLPAELDWIVLRCLEKDRERRYASAHDLAADVDRLLTHQPLEAGPPGTWYRVRKFVRRHRAATVAVVGIGLALLAGSIGTTVGLLRAERLNDQLIQSVAETRAANTQLDAALVETRESNTRLDAALAETRDSNTRLDAALVETREANRQLDAALGEARHQATLAQSVNDFLVNDLLGAARPTGQAGRGPQTPVVELLDLAAAALESTGAARFAEAPEAEAGLRRMIAQTYLTLGLPERGLTHMQRAVALYTELHGAEHTETLDAVRLLGTLKLSSGSWGEAVADQAAAYQGLRAQHGLGHEQTLQAASALATALRKAGQSEQAGRLLDEALPAASAALGDGHWITSDLRTVAAALAADAGRHAEASTLFRRVLDDQTAFLGPDHPVVLNLRQMLATTLVGQGLHDEALQLYLETLAVQREVEGADHPHALDTLYNIAACLDVMGRADEAADIATEAAVASARVLGPLHQRTLLWLKAHAVFAEAAGRLDEAEQARREAWRRVADAAGDEHPSALALALAGELAALLRRMGRADEAAALLAEADPTSGDAEPAPGPDSDGR